jgi:hypothetical protein
MANMTKPNRSPIGAAFRDHPTTVVALLTAGFVILRLTSVSGYHLDVALALLSTGGAPNVVIGTAIALIPLFLPGLASLAIALAFFAPKFSGHRLAMLTIAAFVLVLAIEAGPVFVLVVTTLPLVIGAYFQRRVPRRSGASSSDWEWLPILLPAIAICVLVNRPWLAPELVQVGDQPVLGYIVGSDSRWTTILEDANREILIVDTSTISARRPCQWPPSLFTVSIPDILHPRVGVTLCPVTQP